MDVLSGKYNDLLQQNLDNFYAGVRGVQHVRQKVGLCICASLYCHAPLCGVVVRCTALH